MCKEKKKNLIVKTIHVFWYSLHYIRRIYKYFYLQYGKGTIYSFRHVKICLYTLPISKMYFGPSIWPFKRPCQQTVIHVRLTVVFTCIMLWQCQCGLFTYRASFGLLRWHIYPLNNKASKCPWHCLVYQLSCCLQNKLRLSLYSSLIL